MKPEKPISLLNIQSILASHYEDFPDYDPYLYHEKDETQRSFYYPISTVRTSNGHVTVVDKVQNLEDIAIANIEYIALGMPAVSIYLPVYYGITNKPSALTKATDQVDSQKLFCNLESYKSYVFYLIRRKIFHFSLSPDLN